MTMESRLAIHWCLLTFVSMLFVDPVYVRGEHLDLVFELRLQRNPKECKRGLTGEHLCRLPYALSILQSEIGDFDLTAVMLQEGHVQQTSSNRRHFREDTVVTLPRGVRQNKETRLYVGVKIYGLPPPVQDYFIIDASNVLRQGTKKSAVAVENGEFSFTAIMKPGRAPVMHTAQLGCSCQGPECGCCERLEVPKIELNATACANITYLSHDIGISVTFSLNGWTVYNETVSARNPPPICFNVPYLKEYASLCLRFHNLDVGKERLSGCVRVEAELYHVRISEHELGCFHLGPKTSPPSIPHLGKTTGKERALSDSKVEDEEEDLE